MQAVQRRQSKSNLSVTSRDAISMFGNHELSLAAAAKVAGQSLPEMLTIVSEMGIPVVDYSKEGADAEAATLEKLLGDSRECRA